MNKIINVVFGVSLVFGLAACGDGKKQVPGAGANALPVEAFVVVEESYNDELTTTADIKAEEQVEIMAPMSGQVMAIFFKEGQSVSKGQSLVRMDDRIWQAQLLGVKAELYAAQKDLDRKKQLLAVEGSSQEELDNVFSKIEMLKSQQQQLLVNIDLANITAPFSGQLGMRNFSIGAFMKQGELITTLSTNNQLKVDFSISQMYAKSIAINNSVTILIGKDTFRAKVYAINPLINSETRTLNVRAMLEQKGANKIKPGTFAEVLISTNMVDNAILIPTQAVVPSINEQTVYISKNGKATRKTIKLGSRTKDKVLVLEGLSVGDTLITTGLLNIKEGMGLKIQKIK